MLLEKVLVAEDDAIARRVLATILQRAGFDPVVVADGDEAWAVLCRPDAPKMALLDGEMPGIDGIELCRRVRALDHEPYTWILLLAGRRGRADVVAGLDAGADDYVAKPFYEAELRARLRAGRRIVSLHADVVAAREAMRHLAHHDALTGALNRAGILEAVDAELARLRRHGTPFALAMVDLDHFKRVNDTFGHAVGDAVLREAASRMAGNLRPYDHVGRLGGEEFLLVLATADADGARATAERVRACLAQRPVEADGRFIPVTASIGLALGDAAADGQALIRRADTALYEAKARGRNQVREAA